MAKRSNKRAGKNRGKLRSKKERNSTKKRAKSNQVFARIMSSVAISDLRAQAAELNQELSAEMLSMAWLKIVYAGRDPQGNGWVKAEDITFPSSPRSSWSVWPEWAYGVAEGAIHFDKHVFVVYSSAGDPPDGNNITLALCSNVGG